MGRPLRVLIVEDSEDDALLLIADLRAAGFDPVWKQVDSAAAMRAALAEQTWDVVLSDYSLPQFDALGALAVLQESERDCPFIVVSGTIGEDTAVAVMKAGASDYIMKDNLARLIPAVERGLREAEARVQRRQLEETLRQAQKLEAVGRLAGGVAHDFNNLLTVIRGCSEMLQARLDADDPCRGLVDEIARASRRAASLTQQLLAFSRKQLLVPEVLDLNAVVEETDRLLQRLIGENITRVLRLSPDLGAVKADPGQLQQVLINLAINARDAMPDGGTLTIETANVELDATRAPKDVPVAAGSYVLLAVTDTGCGIDAEAQAHIFEPFFTTKEVGKGTGLGLATIYGIVKQSDGYIWVHSAPGEGARFEIYLPRVQAAVQPAAVPAPPPTSTRGTETILVAEDEAQVRFLVREVLRASGYHVLETSFGDEALRVSDEYAGTIHLLLADLVMPGMNGRQLAEALVARRPDLRVLFMSGYTDDSVIRRGAEAAGIALLQKPYSPTLLEERVRAALDAPAGQL